MPLTKSYSNFPIYLDHAHTYVYTYIIMYIHDIVYTYMYVYIWATVCQSQHESKNDYRVSSFHHEFRRERKPDLAEEESVGLLKALRRGRRD